MMNSHDIAIEDLKARFGSQTSEEELNFLMRTRELFEYVLTDRRGFMSAIEIVSGKLRNIVRARFDEKSGGGVFDTLYELPILESASLLAKENTVLSDEEAKFLRDSIGAIDFVIRNGIGFELIAGAIGHDINEILHHGSMRATLAACVKPKVEGWGQFDEDSIGGPEDIDPDD